MMYNRAFGPYGWSYWALMLCNVLVPQALWSRRVRTNPVTAVHRGAFVNVGMWLERFVIVIISLHRDFTPSRWGMYYPTFWDYATFAGTIGLFFTLLFLFIRFLPMISMTEVRELVAEGESEPVSGPRTAARLRALANRTMTVAPVIDNPPRLRQQTLYGLVARFDTPRGARRGDAQKAYDAGYRHMDAYSPVPVEGLAEAMGRRGTSMPLIVLLRRHRRRVERLLHAVVFGDDRLPVQHRRTAVQQLADVHPDHL